MSNIIFDNFSLSYGSEHSVSEILDLNKSEDKIFLGLRSKGLKKSLVNSLKESIVNIYNTNVDSFKKKDDLFEFLIRELNKDFGDSLRDTDVFIGLYLNGFLFGTQAGEAEVYLIRNNKLSVICENEDNENEKGDLFSNISSGELLNSDIIVFSTNRILRYLTPQKLVLTFSGISEGTNMIKELFEKEEISNTLIAVHIQKQSVFASRVNRFAEMKDNKFEQFVDGVNKGLEKVSSIIVQKTNYQYETIQKSLIAGLGVLAFIFLVSLVAISSQNSKEKVLYEQNKIEILKIDKQFELAESRALMQATDDANAILDKIEQKANEILYQGMFRNEAISILEKSQKLRDDFNKITRFKDSSSKKLSDLSMIQGIELKGFIPFAGAYFAYDKNKFYKIVLDKLENEIPFLQGEEIAKVTLMKDKKKIVIISSSNVLYEFDGTKFEKITTSDENGWRNYVDVKAYSRFVYFLDNGGVVTDENSSSSGSTSSGSSIGNTVVGHVWKYSREKDGYSKAKEYTSGIDFKDALSFAIDGSIYVLYKNGFINQLYNGKEVNFSYGGSPDIIKNASLIYTDIDYLNIYLVDFVNNKIIMLGKSREGANYKRQYIFEDFQITGISVDQNEQEMIISGKNAIYKIAITK